MRNYFADFRKPGTSERMDILFTAASLTDAYDWFYANHPDAELEDQIWEAPDKEYEIALPRGTVKIRAGYYRETWICPMSNGEDPAGIYFLGDPKKDKYGLIYMGSDALNGFSTEETKLIKEEICKIEDHAEKVEK